MGSEHGLEMTATGEHRRRLSVVLVITGSVLVAEVIGGLIAGSLALLADAGHMLTDATGLILALIAASLATRAATMKPVSYTHLTLPTIRHRCRSRWSPYH